MRNTILMLSLVGTFFCCKENKKKKVEAKKEITINQPELAKDNIDIKNSILTWKGTKIGGSHKGTVAFKKGYFLIQNQVLKSGEFTIDMNTINCSDLKKINTKQKLEKHLKSTDFFDVSTYPTAKFVITKVISKGQKFDVTGNLKIKNVTKSVTIPLTLSSSNGIATLKSDVFKIDRSDFGVKYNSKKFFNILKDKVIDDLIEFSFVIKQKE